MFAIRAPFAVAAGASLAVAIFAGLGQLVSVPFDVAARDEAVRIEFTRQIPETFVEPTRPEKPERKAPEPVVVKPRGPGGIAEPVVFRRPEPTAIARPARSGWALGVDRDALPLVRIDPDYPPRAAANGVQGWVRVRFTVTAVGTVRDAVVVASEPGAVFDDAALEAVTGWRYNPRVDGGVAVERVGLEALIKFRLDDE